MDRLVPQGKSIHEIIISQLEDLLKICFASQKLCALVHKVNRLSENKFKAIFTMKYFSNMEKSRLQVQIGEFMKEIIQFVADSGNLNVNLQRTLVRKHYNMVLTSLLSSIDQICGQSTHKFYTTRQVQVSVIQNIVSFIEEIYRKLFLNLKGISIIFPSQVAKYMQSVIEMTKKIHISSKTKSNSDLIVIYNFDNIQSSKKINVPKQEKENQFLSFSLKKISKDKKIKRNTMKTATSPLSPTKSVKFEIIQFHSISQTKKSRSTCRNDRKSYVRKGGYTKLITERPKTAFICDSLSNINIKRQRPSNKSHKLLKKESQNSQDKGGKELNSQTTALTTALNTPDITANRLSYQDSQFFRNSQDSEFNGVENNFFAELNVLKPRISDKNQILGRQISNDPLLLLELQKIQNQVRQNRLSANSKIKKTNTIKSQFSSQKSKQRTSCETYINMEIGPKQGSQKNMRTIKRITRNSLVSNFEKINEEILTNQHIKISEAIIKLPEQQIRTKTTKQLILKPRHTKTKKFQIAELLVSNPHKNRVYDNFQDLEIVQRQQNAIDYNEMKGIRQKIGQQMNKNPYSLAEQVENSTFFMIQNIINHEEQQIRQQKLKVFKKNLTVTQKFETLNIEFEVENTFHKKDQLKQRHKNFINQDCWLRNQLQKQEAIVQLDIQKTQVG